MISLGDISSKKKVRKKRDLSGRRTAGKDKDGVAVSGEVHNEELFFELLKARGLPEPVKEYQFSSFSDAKGNARKFRFDYCFPQAGVFVEVDGGIFMRVGRHNSPVGIKRDMVKKNQAAAEGWRGLFFTPQEIATDHAVDMIYQAFYGGGDWPVELGEYNGS